jgi:hypothetical protein
VVYEKEACKKKRGVICSFEKTKLLKGAKLAVPTAADLVRGWERAFPRLRLESRVKAPNHPN